MMYHWFNYYEAPYPHFYRFGYFPPVNLYYPSEYFYIRGLNQKTVKGTATWTEGGIPTQCGIPWSSNNYMTAAVSTNSPYQCGERLKIKNISIPEPKEIVVTIVDKVKNFPIDRINLHKNAFVALGSPISVGIIDIEISPVQPPKRIEYAMWGKLLLELTHKAYPNYNIVDYQLVGIEQVAENITKEIFDFVLKSNIETLRIRAVVLFNLKTERVISINFEEKTPTS